MATTRKTGGSGSLNSKTARTIKKNLKKIPASVKAILVVFLLIGIAAGAFACVYISKNDRFVLCGETSYIVEVGSDFRYKEEGADVVCFGMRRSDSVQAETALEKDAEGNYIIPTENEAVYSIVYTSDSFKFGGKAGTDPILRVRTFTVVNSAEEEDGRGE